MKKKMWKLLSLFLFLLSMMFVFSPQSIQAATTINYTSGAYQEGSNVYYVLKVESDLTSTYSHHGNIRKYNINTNKSTLVAKGKYVEIIADSNYFYATEDKNLGGGGYSYSCTIYRIDKNGKNRKKLDHGESPVKIGKYLYYIKTKSWNGLYQDPIGIYRMTTSGTDKKCLYRGSFHDFGYAGKKLYFGSSGNFYSMNLDGSGLKKVNFKNYYFSVNGYSDYKVVCNGWSYMSEKGTYFGRTLYAFKNGTKKKIASSDYAYSEFIYIIQLKNWILVRTTSKEGRWWYYYIMKPNGADRHYVCKTIRGN